MIVIKVSKVLEPILMQLVRALNTLSLQRFEENIGALRDSMKQERSMFALDAGLCRPKSAMEVSRET